jgi:hypothetical protein
MRGVGIHAFVILGLDPRIHAAALAEEFGRTEFWTGATL